MPLCAHARPATAVAKFDTELTKDFDRLRELIASYFIQRHRELFP